MASKKLSRHQPALFRQNVPVMSSGFYSSGPNPNLRQFVEEHATSYSPDTDEYRVLPFDKPLRATKATAIYNMHTYWSKKPHGAVRKYIEHFTSPGDLVLDPFCGSGGTALMAMALSRPTVAIDISPAATFLARYYTEPIDLEEAKAAFSDLQKATRVVRETLYGTTCPTCNGRAEMKYAVHSETFRCLRCFEYSPLYLWKDGRVRRFRGKKKPVKICPNCSEEINTQKFPRGGHQIVAVCVVCLDGCKPKLGYRQLDDDTLTETDRIGNENTAGIELPKDFTDENHIFRWLIEPRLEKNIAKAGAIGGPASLYTPRNITAINHLKEQILRLHCSESIRYFLLGVLTSISLINSRMCDFENTQISKGTYYIPHINKELNVFQSFERRFKAGLRGKRAINETIGTTACLISTQDATDLQAIPANSVDYIFTDPPYGGKVQYAALNAVWEYHLGMAPDWQDREVVVSEHRGISESDWRSRLQGALRECYRVLKPGRWISICFHGNEGLWHLLQDITTEAGFITEKGDEILAIDALQKSYNQQTGDQVFKKDLVINFRKPRIDEVPEQTVIVGNESPATFNEKARAILSEALNARPGSTIDHLYDVLVSRMVRKRSFERHNFHELLGSVAEEVNGRWYLLETADQMDAAESAKEEAAAARLEAFMNGYLAERPTETGVHYSDLFEQYLPITDKPRRLLADWLPEFFFKTEAGTWRPPANEEEREQKAALRTSGTLRRIRRFGNALLEGVPPAERDRPENVATAADWIRQCRRAGLYELGRALYEKGGFSFDELSDEAFLEVEEDYQICVRRSA